MLITFTLLCTYIFYFAHFDFYVFCYFFGGGGGGGYKGWLKEKLPQAFMQIEWMENDFRNLTAKVWVNFDNSNFNQELWFFKVLVNFLYAALSGGSVLIYICDVTTVQLSIGTVHKFLQHFYFSWKCIFPLLFCIGMLGLIYVIKLKNCEILCTKSMESCSLVISQILAEFRLLERATYKTLHN